MSTLSGSVVYPRHVVFASPGRGIFDVIVPWHVFRCNMDLIARLLGRQQRRGQPSHAGSDLSSENSKEYCWKSTYPMITIFLDMVNQMQIDDWERRECHLPLSGYVYRCARQLMPRCDVSGLMERAMDLLLHMWITRFGSC